MPGILGEPALNRESLSAAISELKTAIDDEGLSIEDKFIERLARRTIKTYLKAKDTVEPNGRFIAIETRKLIAMPIGAIEVFRAVAPQVMRSRMKTARAKMHNPNARWAIHTMPDFRISVKRLEDGASYHHDPRRNKRACFLASLRIDETQITKILRNRQSLSTNLKIAARKILGKDNADWKAKTVDRGIAVTRTS